MNQNQVVEAFRSMIKNEVATIHTSMPGIFISYSPHTGRASVQPALKHKFPDGRMIAFPVIVGVPVMFPKAMGGRVSITWPVQPGDECTIFFAERNIDDWLHGGESDDPRQYDLTDAYVYPGGSSTPIPSAQEHPNDMCLRNGTTTFRLEPSGAVYIDSADLVVNGISFLQHIHSESIGSVTGPPE